MYTVTVLRVECDMMSASWVEMCYVVLVHKLEEV